MENERERAEVLALQALGWLVGNEDVLAGFLAASGSAPGDFAVRAGEAAFQISVLDFLMNEDAWVIAFCDSVGQPYDAPMRARQLLPGGAQVHWT